ncbi:hypothetical protein HK102_010382, partial [Quaeritorhiza haematococci]
NDDTRVEKTGPIVKRQGEFLVYLVPGGVGSSRASRDAMTAVRILNRLPAVERGGRRVRLVLTEPGTDPRDSAIAASADRDLRCLLDQCDAALAPAGELSAETSIHVAAALASHLPVIAPNRGPIHDMLTLDGCTAGIAPKANEHRGLDVHRMVAAMSPAEAPGGPRQPALDMILRFSIYGVTTLMQEAIENRAKGFRIAGLYLCVRRLLMIALR